MARLSAKLAGFASDESGATAIEYGLIATLIAISLIACVTLVGGGMSDMFNMISDRTEEAMPTSL